MHSHASIEWRLCYGTSFLDQARALSKVFFFFTVYCTGLYTYDLRELGGPTDTNVFAVLHIRTEPPAAPPNSCRSNQIKHEFIAGFRCSAPPAVV